MRGLNVTSGKPVAIKITNQNRQNQECGNSEVQLPGRVRVELNRVLWWQSENTRRAQSRNVVKVHEVTVAVACVHDDASAVGRESHSSGWLSGGEQR